MTSQFSDLAAVQKFLTSANSDTKNHVQAGMLGGRKLMKSKGEETFTMNQLVKRIENLATSVDFADNNAREQLENIVDQAKTLDTKTSKGLTQNPLKNFIRSLTSKLGLLLYDRNQAYVKLASMATKPSEISDPAPTTPPEISDPAPTTPPEKLKDQQAPAQLDYDLKILQSYHNTEEERLQGKQLFNHVYKNATNKDKELLNQFKQKINTSDRPAIMILNEDDNREEMDKENGSAFNHRCNASVLTITKEFLTEFNKNPEDSSLISKYKTLLAEVKKAVDHNKDPHL